MSTARQEPAEVRSTLLPVQGAQLLLPNTAIAEVCAFQPPQPIPNAPAWLMGCLNWRNRVVPLLSFMAAMAPGTAGGETPARIAICNTMNGKTGLTHLAIGIRSTPRLVKVTRDQLSSAPAEDHQSTLVLARVTWGGETAIIPDLERLERDVLEHLSL